EAKTYAESAQAQAEAAQQRLAFLADASLILGSSLEDRPTLEQVAQLAVRPLGDMCAIDLVEPDAAGTVEASAAPAVTRQHEELEKTRQRLSAEAIAIRRIARYESHDGANLAGLAVPLLAGRRVLGTLICLRAGPSGYD